MALHQGSASLTSRRVRLEISASIVDWGGPHPLFRVFEKPRFSGGDIIEAAIVATTVLTDRHAKVDCSLNVRMRIYERQFFAAQCFERFVDGEEYFTFREQGRNIAVQQYAVLAR